MSEIILDFGSGNSCLNDKEIVKKMYDELKNADTGKHQIICKWQLFKEAGQNIPLHRDVFDYAHKYGNKLGYQVTSSVFDKESLDFLSQFDVPFVKLANRRELDWLIGEVPRRVPVYSSRGKNDYSEFTAAKLGDYPMLCVSKYPCDLKDYENMFGNMLHINPISDHTTNFDLFHKYRIEIIEMHYKLEDSTGLDAGDFARTPAQLAEIL